MQINNETFYHILPNGLKIVQRATQSDVVYVGLMVGVGTRYERPEDSGMAHYIEHCVFKGTSHYSARQIIRHVEGIGGEINAYTTKEETTYYAATLREHFRSTMHLICDMVLRPTFPKRETDKELSVIFDEIESYNDSPSELIYDDFESLLFRGNPLAMPILGNKRTLRHIGSSPQKPLQWMQQHYRPERTVLFVLGNIPPTTLVRLAEKELGDWQSSPGGHVPLITPGDTDAGEQEYRRHTHQTHIMLGARAYPIGDPRQLTMYLINNILGGGSLNSRLNMSLREKRGLVYTVESQYAPMSDTGYWNVYIACEKEHTEQCLDLTEKELVKLCTTPMTDRQFQRSLKQLEGQMAISAENAENNALAMGKQMLYHGHAPLWQETFHHIEMLTPHDVLEVANEVFDVRRRNILYYK